MCSPVSAILWEIGRKNRWGLLVVVGSLLCGLMVRVFGAGPEAEPNFFGVVGMIVSFLVTFAIWTYADSGAQISFPTRTFALPVRTGVLVNGPIFFGALGITAIHFAWAFLLLLPLGTHYPLGLFTIYWIAALMTFQAIVWCLASWPKALVIVLVLAVVLFVLLAAALVASSEAIRVDVCLLIILPVAYLTARLGIDRQRCGRWHLPAKVRALADKLARVRFRRGRPFATAAQAQLWMESRANAATPLIALGAGLIAVCAVFVHLADRDGVGALASAWFYLCGALLTLWACICGLVLSRDACAKSLSLSSFLATRPVSSGELALAKIRLAARMTLVGWLFYAFGLCLWFGPLGRHADLPLVRQDGALPPTMGFMALALTWHLVGALPVWLTGRIESPAWAGLLLLGGYIALANLLRWLGTHFDLFMVLPWLFGFGLAGKMALAVWALRESLRRRLLSSGAIAGYVLFWVTGTAVFVAAASLLCLATPVPQPLAMLGSAHLLPLARAGLAPLALAYGRHR